MNTETVCAHSIYTEEESEILARVNQSPLALLLQNVDETTFPELLN